MRKTSAANGGIYAAAIAIAVIIIAVSGMYVNSSREKAAAGNIRNTDEVSAELALKSGTAKYWYPQEKRTVMIVRDTDRTAGSIDSWKKLKNFSGGICMSVRQEFGVQALQYGLTGKAGNCNEAIKYLSEIAHNGCYADSQGDLERDLEKYPVLIADDIQVSELEKKGYHIEASVPEEGSLTFVTGILSDMPENVQSIDPGNKCEEVKNAPRVSESDYFEVEKAYVSFNARYRREIFGRKLFAPGNIYEFTCVYIILFLITMIWGASMILRVTGRCNIVIYTHILAFQIFWYLVRMIKYLTPSDDFLYNILWYMYYVPLLFIPVLLIQLSCNIDAEDNKRSVPRIVKVLACISALLSIYVLTNNAHETVFVLNRVRYSGKVEDYSYGIGFIIIYAYIAVLFVTAVAIMIRKTGSMPSVSAKAAPFILLSVIGVFTAGYALKFKIFTDTEITMDWNMIISIMLECFISCGLIQGNSNYTGLFLGSTVNMQILDEKNRCVYSASGATVLDEQQKRFIENNVRTNDSFDTGMSRLVISRIKGGKVIYFNDRSELIAMNRMLREDIEILERNNRLLANQERIKGELAEIKWRNTLLDEIESIISAKIEAVKDIAATLPANAENDNLDIFRKAFFKMSILVCYMKRKSNLYLIGQEQGSIDINDIAMSIRESIRILERQNIEAAFYCEAGCRLPVSCAMLVFDMYEWGAETSVENGCETVFVRLTEINGKLRLLFRLGGMEKQPADNEKIFSELKKNRGITEITNEDGELIMKLEVPYDKYL